MLACSAGPGGTGRAPAPPTVAAEAGAPASGAAPLVHVRAAYSSIASNQAPWWVALEAGYFREQGLDVELSHIDAGATLLAALRNGELQIAASGGPALVLGYVQGLETMIVGSTSSTLDAIVFTRPEIQSVDDLRGKSIGVTRLKAITDVAARLGFQRVGLTPDVDVFTRGTGGLAESLAAMETGAVDGASLNAPAVFEARKRGYRELLSVQNLGISFLSSGIGTTKRVIAEQPEVVDRGVRALAQAVNRLLTDREFGIQIFSKYSRSEDRELMAATIDYARPLYQPDLYPAPEAVQAVLDLEEHPGARTTRPEEIIDARFAEGLRTTGFLDSLPR
jgi:NitT/TauT family transport system substrate-binding protein